MTSAILKWLAAAGAAGLAAALSAILAHVSVAPPGVDSVVGIVIVAVAVKVVSWLISKVPAGD
jgi:threonine/homoserine/homoserine lactone efflux protein